MKLFFQEIKIPHKKHNNNFIFYIFNFKWEKGNYN